MSIRVLLFLLASAVALVFALFVAAGGGFLAYLAGSDPALAIAAGAAAFAATLTLLATLGGLAYTVLRR